MEVTPDVARVIGGNISGTVTMDGDLQEYKLDTRGFIMEGQRVITVLKNRAGLVS